MNKEEIENAILGVKGIIKVGEQINANYITRLADLEKALEQLTSFKRYMGVNKISGMTNSCNIAINAYIPYRENYSGILDILDATFAMIDLANQCNAKFDVKNSSCDYVLEYSSNGINFKSRVTSFSTFVKFETIESVREAISIIESNPELTKLAKIFLGCNE